MEGMSSGMYTQDLMHQHDRGASYNKEKYSKESHTATTLGHVDKKNYDYDQYKLKKNVLKS